MSTSPPTSIRPAPVSGNCPASAKANPRSERATNRDAALSHRHDDVADGPALDCLVGCGNVGQRISRRCDPIGQFVLLERAADGGHRALALAGIEFVDQEEL